jgi:phospholipid/cholesterol/gamma-HCH transport system substrate-binding protein
MPRKIHWTELRVGLIGGAAIVLLVAAIMLFARVGELHGRKATLYIVTSDATGVLKGTEIWLSGQKIGLVRDVRFRPSAVDTSERLVIEAEILADRLPPIRLNSRAHIGPGSSMIGVPVVFISTGSTRYPGVREGDTIHAELSTSITDLGGGMGDAAAAASSLAVEVRGVAARMSDRRGTVGAVMSGGMPALNNAGGRMSSLMNKASKGNGTIGLAMRGNLGERVSSAMAGVDSIKSLASSDRGNIGRFRRDSTLVPTITAMMARIDSLRLLASNPVGTIGRAHNDSTLIRAMDKSRAALDSLMKDIKSHPLRYIAF